MCLLTLQQLLMQRGPYVCAVDVEDGIVAGGGAGGVAQAVAAQCNQVCVQHSGLCGHDTQPVCRFRALSLCEKRGG